MPATPQDHPIGNGLPWGGYFFVARLILHLKGAKRKIPDSPGFSGSVWHRSAQTSGSEDLQIADCNGFC